MLSRTHGTTTATVVLGSGLVLVAVALAFVPGGWATPDGRSVSAYGAGVELTWWHLALMFGAACLFVAHVQVNDQTHAYSLSEVPLVLGLLFATPQDLIVGRLIGAALALGLVVRQPPAKLAFNLTIFLAETTVAVVLHDLLAPPGGTLTAAACGAALVAAASAGQVGAVAVWGVIRIHGGRERLVGLLVTALVTTTANASLAVVAAVLAAASPWALVPLLVVCAVVVAVYRAYARLSLRYGGLRTLYEFTTRTSGTARHEVATVRLLDEARRLMRAGSAMAMLPGSGAGSAAGWRLVTSFASSEELRDGAEPTGGAEPMGGAEPTGGADVLDGAGRARSAAPPSLRPELLPPWLREQVLEGTTVLIKDSSRDQRHRAVLRHLHVADLVAAPMRSGDEVVGMLLVADRLGDVSTFDAEDALMLATLASQAAVTLDNAGLVDRLHEQIQAREADALHDALTGLPNRALFLRRLEESLPQSRADDDAGNRRVVVLLMDLNGFKDVNDTLGHRTGDRLLVEVAERLRRVVPDGATVARLGGDEFAVVMPQAGPDYMVIAESLGEMLREPFTLDQLTLEVGASVGVAVAPDHSDDAATLLQRADVAMYAAKHANVAAALYDPEADWNTQDRLRLAHGLRQAIRTRQLTVHYQPLARTGDGLVTDVEALARWDHPELGAIEPDTFIPLAERTGLIHELTWNVLDQVLTQSRAWRAAGLELTVSVNLSVQSLRDRDLPRKIGDLLEHHRVPASGLTLEVTETGIMTDPGSMTRTLEDLVATGVLLAIDDFGTGHSSLAYLQRLPVSRVKIDKSLVIPMASDPSARTIVRSVIDLAHNLDLQTVAEGVEDRRTLELLTSLGCDYIQGFHLSRPIEAVEVTDWLAGKDGTGDGGADGSGRGVLRPVRKLG